VGKPLSKELAQISMLVCFFLRKSALQTLHFRGGSFLPSVLISSPNHFTTPCGNGIPCIPSTGSPGWSSDWRGDHGLLSSWFVCRQVFHDTRKRDDYAVKRRVKEEVLKVLQVFLPERNLFASSSNSRCKELFYASADRLSHRWIDKITGAITLFS